VFLFTNSSNAQDLVPGQIYTTPDITNNSAWVGAVYQQSLTCWAWGDPGYCGPQPIVRPGGNINFSYGSSYIYQQPQASAVLPPLAGLQVNGYNFGFTAKNGNGWDDGRVDQLTALVRFWDTTGGRGANNLLYGNSWNLSYKYNWTTFNYNETFTTPLAASSIGTVQYGFIGRDNNGWAGPYGPEVMNVNFSLKYSVDPCIANPLYSPTCSGYLAAMQKLLPPAPVQETTVVVQSQPAVEQPILTTTVAAITTTQPTSSTSVVNTTPTVSVSATTQEKTSSSPANLSFALNLIAKNSDRDKATQQQAVASALAESQSAVAKLEQETAQAVTALNAMSATSVEVGVALAGQAQQSSQTSQTSSSAKIAQTQSTGTGLQLPTAANSQQTVTVQQTTQQYQSQQQALPAAEVLANYTLFQAPQLQLLAPIAQETFQPAIVAPVFLTQEQKQAEPEVPQLQTNFLLDRTSPLREILEAAPILMTDFTEQRQDNRNRVIQPNELAAGVDLTKIAVVPVNYASYTNFVLRDASFYEPKEVYKNQTVVDNVRVLRGLGSDQKHQDLVNLQYK
jgi:hypothetical protein